MCSFEQKGCVIVCIQTAYTQSLPFLQRVFGYFGTLGTCSLEQDTVHTYTDTSDARRLKYLWKELPLNCLVPAAVFSENLTSARVATRSQNTQQLDTWMFHTILVSYLVGLVKVLCLVR